MSPNDETRQRQLIQNIANAAVRESRDAPPHPNHPGVSINDPQRIANESLRTALSTNHSQRNARKNATQAYWKAAKALTTISLVGTLLVPLAQRMTTDSSTDNYYTYQINPGREPALPPELQEISTQVMHQLALGEKDKAADVIRNLDVTALFQSKNAPAMPEFQAHIILLAINEPAPGLANAMVEKFPISANIKFQEVNKNTDPEPGIRPPVTAVDLARREGAFEVAEILGQARGEQIGTAGTPQR